MLRTICICSILAWTALAGCSKAPAKACVPGASVACACATGATGAQQCAADGSSLSLCVCQSAAVASPGLAKEAVPVPVVDAAKIAEGRALYEQRCVSCHGLGGKGDGPAAAYLNPKPRDHTSISWHEVATDARIAQVIGEGGASLGKSPLMPPQPDLKNTARLQSLVQYVRSLRGS